MVTGSPLADPDLRQLCADLDSELECSQNTLTQSCRDGHSLAELWSRFLLKSKDCDFLRQIRSGPPQDVVSSVLFNADLTREPGKCRHGLEFAVPVDGGLLYLVGFELASSVTAWNTMCATNCESWKRLHLGSAILAVNGVIGDVRRMQQELEGAGTAHIVAQSPPRLGDLAASLSVLHGDLPFVLPSWVIRDIGDHLGGTHLDRTFLQQKADKVECQCLSYDDGAMKPNTSDNPVLLAKQPDLSGGTSCEESGKQPWPLTRSDAVPPELGADAVPDITIIITTSPIPSNPSTGMLEVVLTSFALVPSLCRAPKILVCDGYHLAKDGQKPRHKAGKVLLDDAARYRSFKDAVREKAAASTIAANGIFSDLVVLELEEHNGFGHAVRHALQMVSTTFVLVVQHDQQFIHGFDLPKLLDAMLAYPQQLKYVGLCSNTTQNYAQMVRSKFGVAVSRTTQFGVPLVPLIFFYDKPHVCFTEHYRSCVFGQDTLIQKGDFIEETVGKAQRADIMQNGMQAHSKYGTWQLDEVNEAGESVVVVRHVNGRAFLTPEQRVACGWPTCLTFKV